MNTNKNYILRKIAGEAVLVPTGTAARQINGMINMTPVAAYIWEHMPACQDEEEMIELVLKEYEVEEEIARRDVYGFINMLREQGMAE